MNLRKARNDLGKLLRRIVVAYYRLMGVEVGKGVFISLGASLDVRRGHLKIGDGVSITDGCKLLSHDRTAARLRPGDSGARTTVIGPRVFIGMNCVVLPGVTIGENSIIGAGTVVSKDVPPGSVVVGQRMRIIKRFDETTQTWRRHEEEI
ncbi:MAG: acyltransferase [Thermodesulfobacteriota bacterium]